VSHNPSLSDLRRFNVRNLRGQGVVTAPATLAPAMPRTVRAFVAAPIVSTANKREHWTKRHGRNTAQHAAVSVATGTAEVGAVRRAGGAADGQRQPCDFDEGREGFDREALRL
jgi:hypothetical protein